MLSATVFVALTLGPFSLPVQGGKILTRPTGAAKATQAAATKTPPRPPANATVPAVDEGFVDWSYLRLNNPALVEARIARVRNGEAELVTLGGLDRMDKLKEYASGASSPKPPAPPVGGASSKSGIAGSLNRSSVLARPGPANSPLVKASSAVSAAKLMLPLDVSPSRVEFGSVVDGQAVRKTIYLRNAPAGLVRAVIAAKSPFRILKVKVLDGRYAMLRAGAWKDSLIATYSTESAGIPIDLGGTGATSVARPRLDPNVVGRLNPGGGRSTVGGLAEKSAVSIAALAKRSEATQAPFEVDAPEGATVRVELEFRPKFNLFGGDPVGAHRASLELACGDRSATIALQAQFEGVNLGVITIPQDRERTIFLSPKQERHPSGGNMVTAQQKVTLGYELTFLNPKGEVPISVTPIELPSGVTLSSLQPKTAKNGRTEGYLELELSFWGDDRGAQYGMGQELIFSVNSPSGSRTLSLTLNLLPAMRKYSARGSLDNVYYQIDLTCLQDGSIDCEFDFHTTNAWPTDAEFKFSIDGVQMIHYTTIWMNDNNRMKTKGTPKFQVQALADGWERFVQKGGSFWIRVEEKFRL